MVVLAACAGCGWQVEPPRIGAGMETATVFVTDYGRHTRLGLPTADGRVVEWGFGDWDFYARQQTGPVASARALSPFGRATLARRELPDAGDAEAFRRAARGVRTAALVVERDKARALLADLESSWERGRATGATGLEFHGLEFAPVETRYHLFRNSNSKTAMWLRELGCEVRGVPVISNFRVREP